MIILGINDGHDASACLIQDGRLICYSAEERRLNIKNYAGIPKASINAILKKTAINPRDIDAVALSSKIRTTVPTRGHKPIYSILNFMSTMARSETATNIGRCLLSHLRRRKELLTWLAENNMADINLLTIDHHLTHAACAHFHRPWPDDALVLTLDGAGDGLCATVNIGHGNEIKTIARTPKFHSPAAWMYSAATAHLGLQPYEHEYKVMGMAPYGRAEYCIDIFKNAFSVQGLKFHNHTRKMGPAIQRYYAKNLYGQRFDNISAACQKAFELLMVRWTANAVQTTGIKKLACAGGAFLNVKANKLIRELQQVDAFYAYPASDDGGTSVGAAIMGYLSMCRQKNITPKLDLPRDMYIGLDFSTEQMAQAIKDAAVPYQLMDDPARQIAELLAAGNVVARFEGREEAGPRALGNRSILADPRDLSIIRKLNFAIKYRDFWMPFAASILAEDAPKYVKNLNDWPFYMIDSFDTTNIAAKTLIAGMHPYDLTVRPQIVNELNRPYQDILRRFKEITGAGVLLNTSFNLHGYPIVGTPAIALDTLKNSDLDALALGPFLIKKNN
jgi:carbamoyltransferase